MRTPFVAGNWKMNPPGVLEAVILAKDLGPRLEPIGGIEKAICPPFIWLIHVHEALQGASISLGAQNMYYEEKGAFTGEVSPLMLQELCRYVILGHSERRHVFGESDALINTKVASALAHGLLPIFCVGETLEERQDDRTGEVLRRQMRLGLAGVSFPAEAIIAYEPVWAIGTGLAATPQQADEAISLVRRELAALRGEKIAQAVRILYGGSVTAANIAQFVAQPEIDGALVGGASLKADEFASIVAQTAEAKAHA